MTALLVCHPALRAISQVTLKTELIFRTQQSIIRKIEIHQALNFATLHRTLQHLAPQVITALPTSQFDGQYRLRPFYTANNPTARPSGQAATPGQVLIRRTSKKAKDLLLCP